MKGKFRIRYSLALVLLFVPLQVSAVPIKFALHFFIDKVELRNPDLPCDPTFGMGCTFTLGERHTAEFDFDSAGLNEDGLDKNLDLSRFYFRVGEVIWDSENPHPLSHFEGYNGPNGFGDKSWGFDVVNRRIVGMHHGITGRADAYSIGFEYDRFLMFDPQVLLWGSLAWNIPSPGSLMLFLAVLPLLLRPGWRRGRRQQSPSVGMAC